MFIPYVVACTSSKDDVEARRLALAVTSCLGAALSCSFPLRSRTTSIDTSGKAAFGSIGESIPYRIPPERSKSFAAPRRPLGADQQQAARKHLPSADAGCFSLISSLPSAEQVWTIKLLALLGLLSPSVAIVARVTERPRLALALALNPLMH